MKRPREVGGGGGGLAQAAIYQPLILAMLTTGWKRRGLTGLLRIFVAILQKLPYPMTMISHVTHASGECFLGRPGTVLDAAAELERDPDAYSETQLRACVLALLAFDHRIQRFVYSQNQFHELVFGTRPPKRDQLGAFRATLGDMTAALTRNEISCAAYVLQCRRLQEEYYVYTPPNTLARRAGQST